MSPWLRRSCWAAAVLDGGSGLLLMAAPMLALRLMGVQQTIAEPIWIRFIGAFVAGVGFSYLLPWLHLPWAGRSPDRRERLVAVFEITALVRLFVGTFVGVAVLLGALEPAWFVVAVTDLGMAGGQGFWLWPNRQRAGRQWAGRQRVGRPELP